MDDSPRTPVIFDLDGTLVDSEPLYWEAGRRVLAAHGAGEFTWQQHTRFIGISTVETMEALRREYGVDAPVGQLVAEKNRSYLQLAARSARVFPAMLDLVERLHAAGHPLAVASGSSGEAIEAVLEGTGLDDLLPVRVSAEEVERGKPEPDVFLEAARRLGADPARCVVVEDAPPGAEAARRAGMRCVVVPYVQPADGDAAFTGAGLLFAGGQEEFDASRAYEWITGGAGTGQADSPDGAR
ncbi:HAD family hydrolase [Streptomyces ovatisporus]|uniref:HAD family hydrolase n=1 Tax=Streptomyces ovatisporus TaxID=1128682 RepID=A0ABV9A6L3_9ACTN